MDPSELREELQGRAKKKVDLVSPQLPEEEEEDKGSKPSASSDNNDKMAIKSPKTGNPKGLQPPLTTVVPKLKLHCAACIRKIERRIISKIEGLQIVAFNQDKYLVTVTSTMDAKALVETLRERVSSLVEVVQPKKDEDGGGGSGGRKTKKGGGNGSKEGDGGRSDKDGAKEMYGGAGEYFGRSRMEYNGIPPGYGYNYGFMYGNSLHAPQMFSDENPNAVT